MQLELALEIVKLIFPYGAGATGAVLLFVFFLLFHPEKIEKWQAIIWGWIESAGILYRRASKERLRHSIQGTVSGFTRHLAFELPQFDPPKVKIEWIQPSASKKAFIDQGKAVIRLRRDDPNNENIVTACLMFISQILLRKSVRYLSPTQRDAIELFTGFKMLAREAPEVYDSFVDKWLYPGIEKCNEKVYEYFEKFRLIDQSEYFVPVFLQELVFLGDKVYGRRRDDTIIHEVDGAIHFLEVYASRKLGERTDRPSFDGEACRFAIMIIGMSVNVDQERYDIYLNHINERLIPCGVETIYLVGPAKNASFIGELSRLVRGDFDNPFSRNYEVKIFDRDGKLIRSINHLSVLRKKKQIRYIP